MARRIKKARVKFLSLVPRGANQFPVIYKAEGGTVNFSLLTKASDTFDEDGELLNVVYAPEIADSQGDIASAAVIKDMMYTAMRDGFHIDVRHDMQPLRKDQAFVAESFVIQKGDPRFIGFKDYRGNEVDVTGAWGTVLKIEDADLRGKYREGKWNGVSLCGTAEVEQIAKSEEPLESFLRKLETKSAVEDIDMTSDELKLTLEESNKALLECLSKMLKDNEKIIDQIAEEKKQADEKPVFTGDPTPENLRKFAREQRVKAILAKVDWADPESVSEMEKSLKELDEDGAGDFDEIAKAAGVEAGDSAEVRRLKISLFKAQKKSNQPDSRNNVEFDLSKEDAICCDIGMKMAKAMNANRGYKN